MNGPGYIRELPWEVTYDAALAPHHVRFLLAMAGIDQPPGRRCCEVAYGRGLSLVLHAACNPHVAWTGTDFNDEHAAFARALQGDVVLPNLSLAEAPIATYCEAADGPFDLVACTGTWSWLPDVDQAAIAAFAGRTLAPSGALAFDHMTLPGQAAMTSLRRLMVTLAPREARDEGWAQAAVAATRAFCDLQPRFLEQHWELIEQLDRLATTPHAALVHEYFNHHWQPRHLCETAAQVAHHGLDWAASWSAAQSVAALHLAPRQIAHLATIEVPLAREQAKDLLLDQSMRSDLWMRGGVVARPEAARELAAPLRVVLVMPPREVTLTVRGGLGQLALAASLYEPLLSRLADHRPITVGRLAEALAHIATWEDLAQALLVLLGKGAIAVAADDDDTAARARAACHAVNRRLLARAASGSAVGFLGSPVTGGGIAVPRAHQLMLLARLDGATTADRARAFAMRAIAEAGTSNELAAPREDEADAFWRTKLPVHEALQIVPEDR